MRLGEAEKALGTADTKTQETRRLSDEELDAAVRSLFGEATGSGKPSAPALTPSEMLAPYRSFLTNDFVRAIGQAPQEAEDKANDIKSLLDMLPRTALRAERGRRMRAEWWTLRLLEAHSAGRIDDAKLHSALDAITDYLEGVINDMNREASGVKAHYVAPIPGVDYGSGHHGEDFPPAPKTHE